jgi:hypothetical protein
MIILLPQCHRQNDIGITDVIQVNAIQVGCAAKVGDDLRQVIAHFCVRWAEEMVVADVGRLVRRRIAAPADAIPIRMFLEEFFVAAAQRPGPGVGFQALLFCASKHVGVEPAEKHSVYPRFPKLLEPSLLFIRLQVLPATGPDPVFRPGLWVRTGNGAFAQEATRH